LPEQIVWPCVWASERQSLWLLQPSPRPTARPPHRSQSSHVWRPVHCRSAIRSLVPRAQDSLVAQAPAGPREPTARRELAERRPWSRTRPAPKPRQKQKQRPRNGARPGATGGAGTASAIAGTVSPASRRPSPARWASHRHRRRGQLRAFAAGAPARRCPARDAGQRTCGGRPSRGVSRPALGSAAPASGGSPSACSIVPRTP
jgi:hypothetical protein